MYAKLLGFVLFACQIILNGSHVIREATGDAIQVTPTLASAPSTLPEGYVRFPDVHAAYKVYRQGLNWIQAREMCIAEGAVLAIADTVEKIQHIRSVHSDSEHWICVGIRKSSVSDEWVRVDNGLPVANVPWLAGKPDDVGDCTGISLLGDALINYPCRYAGNWHACEIPI